MACGLPPSFWEIRATSSLSDTSNLGPYCATTRIDA
jgi:hypothetical protein